MGNTLVVIEAKSARIHPTARRGAPDRFERVVKDLVIEPSRQSKRFVDYLQQHGGLVTLDTDAGHQNIINVEDVVNYVRFNITLESLGVTGGRWPELQDAGLIQPEEDVAPTLNIADLNSVFEALEGACQKLHYLSRRSEFEKDCVYVGDELDLLVFYLDTGFDVPSFEEGNMVHMLTLLSKSLDPYLMAKARPDLGVKVDKPKLRLTQWWQDILRRFELQHFERWTQAGSLLLDVGFENQSLLEGEFKDIKRNVKRNGDAPGHECAFAVRTNQHSRGIAVAAFAYKGLTLEQRDAKARNVADEILDQFGGEYVLIIGIDVDKEAEHYPYSFSAVVDASNKDK